MPTRSWIAALVLVAGLAGCGQEGAGTASDAGSGSGATAPESVMPTETASPSEADAQDGAEAAPGTDGGSGGGSGKGPGDDSSPAVEARRPYPPCDRIWVAGRDLPVGYAGCRDGKRRVAADQRHCALGRMLVTYADRFYAVPGFRVNAVPEGLGKSKAYRQAERVCTG